MLRWSRRIRIANVAGWITTALCFATLAEQRLIYLAAPLSIASAVMWWKPRLKVASEFRGDVPAA